jgi:hypothetical protein
MGNDLRIVLYTVAVLSSGACALLLFRAYLRRRLRLLMWSAVCFIGLTINNVALFADLIVFPDIDLRLARLIPALMGMTLLLYGFIWDSE